MSNLLAFQVQFNSVGPCSICGVVIVLPSDYEAHRRRDHATFYCPNGHTQYYPSKSTEETLREQLAAKDRALTFERERAATNYAAREKAERANRKLKKRISGGACPCCNRAFTNLQRHMTTKHPDFTKETS